MRATLRTGLDPFYLPGTKGRLFAILHSPAASSNCRGALLFVPSFGEEMNKARRMVAIQARSLATRGWFVLLVDHYGCGDSNGELADATWMTWLTDLELCYRWLAHRAECPVSLWTLRFGALPGLDLAQRMNPPPAQVLLWQPILRGGATLKALLRQRLVAAIGGGGEAAEGTKQLKARLLAGETLELSGYDINSSLADAMDNSSLEGFTRTDIQIDWIDIARSAKDVSADPGSRLRKKWSESGIILSYNKVVGEPFWAAGEILECPVLIQTTNTLLH